MADRLIDLAVRLFNAALAAFAVFVLCTKLEERRGWISRWLSVDLGDNGMLVVVLIAAIAGFLWGHRLWRDRDPWIRRPRK
jgi:hypothetical protein